MLRKNSTKKPVKRTPRKLATSQSLKAASARQRVLDAMHELLHNDEVPSDLYEAVSAFVTDQSNECSQNLYHSTSYLTEVLKSVKPEDHMAARRARWEAEEKEEAK